MSDLTEGAENNIADVSPTDSTKSIFADVANIPFSQIARESAFGQEDAPGTPEDHAPGDDHQEEGEPPVGKEADEEVDGEASDGDKREKFIPRDRFDQSIEQKNAEKARADAAEAKLVEVQSYAEDAVKAARHGLSVEDYRHNNQVARTQGHDDYDAYVAFQESVAQAESDAESAAYTKADGFGMEGEALEAFIASEREAAALKAENARLRGSVITGTQSQAVTAAKAELAPFFPEGVPEHVERVLKSFSPQNVPRVAADMKAAIEAAVAVAKAAAPDPDKITTAYNSAKAADAATPAPETRGGNPPASAGAAIPMSDWGKISIGSVVRRLRG